MRVAVIGAGISGNVAAYLLTAKGFDVAVYEKENRAGGHANTICIRRGDCDIFVDTGFIVFNELNYPNFAGLLRKLGVATVETNMGFSVSEQFGRFEWSARGDSYLETLNGLFAQRSNLLSPAFYRMLLDIRRFNREAANDLEYGKLGDLTLGDYLSWRGFSRQFLQHYLLPMGAAIWSSTTEEIFDFPAARFIAFLKNHLLLQSQRQVWRTVAGGSQSYVDSVTASFRDNIRLGTAVKTLKRTLDNVIVVNVEGHQETFDQVVVATHPDQALAILDDASDDERAILGEIRYRVNNVYVHCDDRLMPKRKAAWAPWNFMRLEVNGTARESVTYWMNVLQDIDRSFPVFVTLNPPVEPAPEMTFARLVYEHPHFDRYAIAAQGGMDSIQGVARTWYCGAWMGYGFHEDGATAGMSVVHKLASGMVRSAARLK
jgi:predicted NAD/FAD-binding protein